MWWFLLREYGCHIYIDVDLAWQQEALLRWLLLREYGSLTCFHDDLAWQHKALLRWLLLGEYGLTLFMFIHMSLLLVFHYVDVMFDSYLANMDNDEGIDICNILYVSWVGEIVHELGLSTLGMNHFILCISCIEENFVHHMVATWRFIDGDGYLNFQLEAILDIL